MRTESWLWDLLHDLFETDDGSLPEIRVNYCDAGAVVAGYELLRNRASEFEGSEFGTIELKDRGARELRLVDRPASLVVSQAAEPFHSVFSGLSVDGTLLPDLGVFVFADQITIDYRMGAEWGPTQVEALFFLLEELRFPDPRSVLSLEEGVLERVARRFRNAWGRYAHEHAAQRAAGADRVLG
jgi:hypothetical protein